MTGPEVALILTGARGEITRAYAVASDNEVRALLLTTLDALDDAQDCVTRRDGESNERP